RATVPPVDDVVDVEPAPLVAPGDAAAAVTVLDERAQPGVDGAPAAAVGDGDAVAPQDRPHGGVAGQQVGGGGGQDRAQVEPGRRGAVGGQVHEDLGALAGRPARPGGGVERAQGGVGEVHQAVGPGHPGELDRRVGPVVGGVGVAQPEDGGAGLG